MKNVLYILNSTTPYGGASKSFLTLVRGVRQQGINPIVMLPDTNGIYHTLKEEGIQTLVTLYGANVYPPLDTWKHKLLFIPSIGIRNYRRYQAMKALEQFMKSVRVDLIHSNTSVVNIGYYAAKEAGIPHIYHIREYADKDFNLHYFPTSSFFHDTLHKENSYSLCITKDIQTHHGLSDTPTSKVIYNGIMQRKEVCPESERRDFLLYAGRIEPAKGVYDLIKAYIIYCNACSSPLPLHIYGEVLSAQYLADIERVLNNEPKAKENVHIHHPQSGMEEIMQQAKAVIIPSLFEGFGRCTAEAMFNGCLVIGRDTGGTKEQFDNGLKLTGGEIGLRFNTVEGLAHKLTEVSNAGHQDYSEMTQRAFSTVNTLYTTENYVSQIIKVYNDIFKHNKL